jgi:hypothetical protein
MRGEARPKSQIVVLEVRGYLMQVMGLTAFHSPFEQNGRESLIPG